MSSHDYNIAAEADLKPAANKQIWGYFFILAILLSLTVGGLVIMYRFVLLDEKYEKIGAVISSEAQEQKALSEALLSGKKGLFPNKRHVPIQAAMADFVHEFRQQ